MELQEWSISRDKGDGWHEIRSQTIEVTRSGDIVKRSGIAFTYATAFGTHNARAIVRVMAGANGGVVRHQTDEELADPNSLVYSET